MNIGRKDYIAPSERMCVLLIDSLSRISDLEQLESQDLAKRLYDLYEAPKRWAHTNHIADAFPWLHQIGVLSYKFEWVPKGGHRLLLWRKIGAKELSKIISEQPDIRGGILKPRKPGVIAGVVSSVDVETETVSESEPEETKTEKKAGKKRRKKKSEPVACASEGKKKSKNKKPSPKKADAPDVPAKKKRRKCCDEPRIVRSNKTGKRRCKNCGAKLKDRKAP
jgi:hypothetical protein